MFRKLTFTIIGLALLLAACAPAGPAPAPLSTEAPPPPPAESPVPVTLTDGLGRSVTLAAPARRIVSLAPSNTEVLFAVGAGDQLVGRDEFSDYPAEALAVESVGGSMGQFSLEAIVSLQTDLVLAGGINPPELVKAIEDLGLTVYFLPNPNTLEEMYTNLETVGQLTGHLAEAQTLVAALKERVAAVDEKLADVTERPTVFYELDSTDPAKPWTAGAGTFIDLLIQRAGGENVAAGMSDAWAQFSLEQLLVSDPQFILLGDSIWGVTPESVALRPGWEALTAVQEGRVLPIDDNMVSRPGPRLVDGLEALARLLHPELFD
jgi:iron complex transport system substrate-binding protein